MDNFLSQHVLCIQLPLLGIICTSTFKLSF